MKRDAGDCGKREEEREKEAGITNCRSKLNDKRDEESLHSYSIRCGSASNNGGRWFELCTYYDSMAWVVNEMLSTFPPSPQIIVSFATWPRTTEYLDTYFRIDT